MIYDFVELTALVIVLFLLSPLLVVGFLSDWIEEKMLVDSYDND
jgi:hypothetical protein